MNAASQRLDDRIVELARQQSAARLAGRLSEPAKRPAGKVADDRE